MIARHEGSLKGDVWERIAAPVPASEIQWRQQGKPKQRDGKWFAPFVAYIDAQIVRERLDDCVPGEWDLTLEMLPALHADGEGVVNDEPCAFKARLQILGAIREDVGNGRDYKNAATDAFKRAAMRFGVGHELYTDYEITWVQVDSDSKYAKPVEDPAAAYARRHGTGVKSAGAASPEFPVRQSERQPAAREPNTAESSAAPARQQPAPASAPVDEEASCPKCGGAMYDNRLSKRNPKAPDFKCKNRACDGVIWPPKKQQTAAPTRVDEESQDAYLERVLADEADLPF